MTKKKKRKFSINFITCATERARLDRGEMENFYSRTFFLLLLAVCSSDGMEPSTIHVDRNWDIPDSTRVGEIVKTVRVTGNYDPNSIKFTLEPDDPWNKDLENPFWINSQTGFVYLNKSLEGWVSVEELLN